MWNIQKYRGKNRHKVNLRTIENSKLKKKILLEIVFLNLEINFFF